MKTVKLYNGVNMPCVGFGTDRTFIFIRKNVLARCNGAFQRSNDWTWIPLEA